MSRVGVGTRSFTFRIYIVECREYREGSIARFTVYLRGYLNVLGARSSDFMWERLIFLQIMLAELHIHDSELCSCQEHRDLQQRPTHAC